MITRRVVLQFSALKIPKNRTTGRLRCLGGTFISGIIIAAGNTRYLDKIIQTFSLEDQGVRVNPAEIQ